MEYSNAIEPNDIMRSTMRVTAGVGLGMVIFLLITLVISIVAVWKIFKKMGQKPHG